MIELKDGKLKINKKYIIRNVITLMLCSEIKIGVKKTNVAFWCILTLCELSNNPCIIISSNI